MFAVELRVSGAVLGVDRRRIVRSRRKRGPDGLVHRPVRRREARPAAGAVHEVRRARRVDEDLRANRARPLQAVDDRRRDALAVADGSRQVRVEELLDARLVQEVVVADAHVLDARADAAQDRLVADRTRVVGLVALVVRQEPRRAALREPSHELVRDAADVLHALVGIVKERRRVAVRADAARIAVVLDENRPLPGPRRGHGRTDAARTRAHDADVEVAQNRHVLRDPHRPVRRPRGLRRARVQSAGREKRPADPDERPSVNRHAAVLTHEPRES